MGRRIIGPEASLYMIGTLDDAREKEAKATKLDHNKGSAPPATAKAAA